MVLLNGLNQLKYQLALTVLHDMLPDKKNNLSNIQVFLQQYGCLNSLKKKIKQTLVNVLSNGELYNIFSFSYI